MLRAIPILIKIRITTGNKLVVLQELPVVQERVGLAQDSLSICTTVQNISL
jgi:hypothetical protein